MGQLLQQHQPGVLQDNRQHARAICARTIFRHSVGALKVLEAPLMVLADTLLMTKMNAIIFSHQVEASPLQEGPVSHSLALRRPTPIVVTQLIKAMVPHVLMTAGPMGGSTQTAMTGLL